MKNERSDYEEYLDKYCEKRKIPREEAEKHLIVREYKKQCEERDLNEESIHA